MEMSTSRDAIHVTFIPPNHWWQNAKWELMKEYVSDNKQVTVPVGFVTDGASIPILFRWRFSPTGKYFGAAIIHDYLLVSTGDWKLANAEFDHEMEALDVSTVDRFFIINAVKFWAWIQTKVLKKERYQ